MKTRLGFVSNSSSSSFVCCLTGRIESGWDISAKEAEMYQCVNGHTFDEKFIDLDDEWNEKLREKAVIEIEEYSKKHPDYRPELDDWIDDMKSEFRYELPPEFCPVCSLKEFTPDDLTGYYIALTAEIAEMNKKDAKQHIYEHIRSKFQTYKEFEEYIK